MEKRWPPCTKHILRRPFLQDDSLLLGPLKITSPLPTFLLFPVFSKTGCELGRSYQPYITCLPGDSHCRQSQYFSSSTLDRHARDVVSTFSLSLCIKTVCSFKKGKFKEKKQTCMLSSRVCLKDLHC